MDVSVAFTLRIYAIFFNDESEISVIRIFSKSVLQVAKKFPRQSGGGIYQYLRVCVLCLFGFAGRTENGYNLVLVEFLHVVAGRAEIFAGVELSGFL